MQKHFLPATPQELKQRHWTTLDIIIINGDAYVDHPSFGAAIIGRILEYYGYKVGIISQPQTDEDFSLLGRPNLFFAITAGNIDSMVNHYTAQKKIRSEDAYSPNGKAGLRPDRAVIQYTQTVKRLFKKCFVVIGGIEASLRRIPHYDFWSDKVKNSVLFDSKADILVYGAGERSIVEIANSLKNNTDYHSIKGTALATNKIENDNYLLLPNVENCSDKNTYRTLYKTFFCNYKTKTLYQPFATRFLKHNIPQEPFSEEELTLIYSLPYQREPHPIYNNNKIPAFEQIKHSITTHRGCYGGCNFCSIAIHQGKSIQSRSINSILNEIGCLTQKEYFKGTLSDIGGPSANMYASTCTNKNSDNCMRRSCIVPSICSYLHMNKKEYYSMLKACLSTNKVKHGFIASGIRFDISTDQDYLELLVSEFTGGRIKLAPEHIAPKVLQLMNKPTIDKYEEFNNKFISVCKKHSKAYTIIPYIILGHPGCSMNDAIDLAIYLKKHDLKLEQIQEFTPTPMTISTCMYYTGKAFDSDVDIFVPKGREVKLQKAIAQWYKEENRKYVIEILKTTKRMDLLDFFLKNRNNTQQHI